MEPDVATPGWPEDAARTTPARFLTALALFLVGFVVLAFVIRPDALGFVVGGAVLVGLNLVIDRVLVVRRNRSSATLEPGP